MDRTVVIEGHVEQSTTYIIGGCSEVIKIKVYETVGRNYSLAGCSKYILLSRSVSGRCGQKDFSQFSYSNWKLKGGNLSQRSVLGFTWGEVSSILFQLTMDKHSGMTGQQRTKKIQISC